MRHESVVDAIGHTPVVRLAVDAPEGVEVYAKLELQNLFAMKDRVARQVEGWAADAEDPPPDPARLRAETLENIGRWNELGRSLCAAFLEEASSQRSSGSSGYRLHSCQEPA